MTMDLSKYKLEDVLLAAIKSEIEAKEVYEKLSWKVRTAHTKGRLEMLAEQEAKHKETLEDIFKEKCPGKQARVPKKTPVPAPRIIVEDKSPFVSVVLEAAMKAEKAAKDFYDSMTHLFNDDNDIREIIESLANMEAGHYRFLEQEVERLKREEDYVIDWPMMHAGP